MHGHNRLAHDITCIHWYLLLDFMMGASPQREALDCGLCAVHPASGRQAEAGLTQSWTRPPTLTLQFGMDRSIDLSQFARSLIYWFIALTGRSIREAEAAPVDRMRI
jgi:hypothetical protein